MHTVYYVNVIIVGVNKLRLKHCFYLFYVYLLNYDSTVLNPLS